VRPRLRAWTARQKPEFDEFRLGRFGLAEPGEGLVEREEIEGGRLGDEARGIEINAMVSAAVFEAVLAPGVLDEDPPHGLGGGSEEVPATIIECSVSVRLSRGSGIAFAPLLFPPRAASSRMSCAAVWTSSLGSSIAIDPADVIIPLTRRKRSPFTAPATP
jgi:hypothetical protein